MKLLIVDDSKLNHVVAEQMIKKNELGIETASVFSGDEAIELIKNDTIDIVLLDIMMPNMSGTECLKNIRRIDRKHRIKVLMYTTVHNRAVLAECFESGATDYITKPLDEIDFVARLRNVMKQIEIEKEKEAYIQEIKKQTEIIKSTQSQLVNQEKLAGIGQLAAGVAHEINNPLGFIVSNFKILKEYIDDLMKGYDLAYDSVKAKDSNFNPNIDKHLKELDYDFIKDDIVAIFDETQTGINRVVDIVKSLRNFSRIDNLGTVEPYNVNEAIETTLIIANNNIKYVAEVEKKLGNVPEILCYGNEVNQVLLNIIVNAAHAIEEMNKESMGKITIESRSDKSYVYISVSDDGTGIKEDDMGVIFNPFFTTKSVGSGTGLGLSISYDIIVNKHGGKLIVDSEYGKGTTFTIVLPLVLEIE